MIVTKDGSFQGAVDNITREVQWALMNIFAAASLGNFPVDGRAEIAVTVTKERSTTGAVATIDCTVGLTVGDSVPESVAEALTSLVDKGPPAEDFH